MLRELMLRCNRGVRDKPAGAEKLCTVRRNAGLAALRFGFGPGFREISDQTRWIKRQIFKRCFWIPVSRYRQKNIY
jgi:hypothetical protein